MRRYERLLLAACCAAGFLTGCVREPTYKHPAERFTLGLPDFTTALAGEIHYGSGEHTVIGNEAALIRHTIKNRTDWETLFTKAVIKVWHNNTNAVVLLCSPDGKSLWLEDASWTPHLDCRWYQIETQRPVSFSLDPTTKRAIP